MRYRPMPSAPRSTQCAHFVRKLDVAEQLDPHAVGRLGRQIARARRAAPRARALLLGLVPIAGERLFVGLQDHQPLVAVDDHQVAAGNVGQERPGADDRRNFQPLGDDRRVAAGAADLGDEAAHELAVEIGRFAGREIVGQDHDRRGELRKLLAAAAEQVAQQPLLDVEDVVGPLGQVAALERLEHLGVAAQACG